MERRAFLAIGISLLVLYLYQAFVLGPATPPETKTPTTQTAAAPARSTRRSRPPRQHPPATPAHAAVTADDRERRIVVDTGEVEARAEQSRWTRAALAVEESPGRESGGPVDLVPSNLPLNRPRRFRSRCAMPVIEARANDGLYRVSGDATASSMRRRQQARSVFEYEDAAGLQVRKELVLRTAGLCVHGLSINVSNGASQLTPTVEWGPGLGDVGATDRLAGQLLHRQLRSAAVGDL